MKLASPVLRATVSSDRQITVHVADLSPGQQVEIIVLTPDSPAPSIPPLSRKDLLPFLHSLTGQRLLRTPDDVRNYLDQERDSWGN